MDEPVLVKKELFDSLLESKAYANYQEIKEGTYFGEVKKVELIRNKNDQPVIMFLLFYRDRDNERCFKSIYARYPLFGNGRNYTISSLAPVALSKGIVISSNMTNQELLLSLKHLTNKFTHFNVEITRTNKNIRLMLCREIYQYFGLTPTPYKEVVKM